MGILDKAKEAKSSATAKAAEVRRDVAAKAGELKEQASAKAVALKDSATHMGGELMESAMAKVKDTVRDFNDALPIVRKAGYMVEGISIELGIPPKIYANFETTHHLAEEAQQEILEAHAENKLAVALVKSLSQAQKLQGTMTLGGLAPRGITVELGLIPNIVIKFGVPVAAASIPVASRSASERPAAAERALPEVNAVAPG
ncbi:hypothetical protein [Pendulispora albinea]|uniref:Uncharacterized protein n=1 Tax=Pendulispora albinea TaxID=2741071 RepID=A0ABZ2LW53_9BACT